jgi:hypothetical protein
VIGTDQDNAVKVSCSYMGTVQQNCYAGYFYVMGTVKETAMQVRFMCDGNSPLNSYAG